MLKLWNKDRIAKAADVLQSVSTKVNEALENRPISIQLRGLTCMKGSPAKARVVYAPVLEVGGEGRLARACKVITDAFVKSGLVFERDARELKLHATVMNVRHRKRKYGNEDWGEYPIHEVHLSQRFKFDKSGYYYCCPCLQRCTQSEICSCDHVLGLLHNNNNNNNKTAVHEAFNFVISGMPLGQVLLCINCFESPMSRCIYCLESPI
ncbi:hypothetical protein BDA96_03G007200 [Sorghum bicolor]|uniref:A-kinase anchor protein 7-like phosphoesterase domain-containing protein n=1 Tax=Sorghum bicolor TaxID=4558 RepID=A0A921UND5_SORBI|nr:hypothetical protein BDA96_03G007200 [Sorghum bicolor]